MYQKKQAHKTQIFGVIEKMNDFVHMFQGRKINLKCIFFW